MGSSSSCGDVPYNLFCVFGLVNWCFLRACSVGVIVFSCFTWKIFSRFPKISAIVKRVSPSIVDAGASIAVNYLVLSLGKEGGSY